MTDQDQEIYKDFNLTVSERWQQEIAGKGSHMQQCLEKLHFDFYLWLILEKASWCNDQAIGSSSIR